jgi:hypothetical protein
METLHTVEIEYDWGHHTVMVALNDEENESMAWEMAVVAEKAGEGRGKKPLCDFCSAKNVVARFKCDDFQAYEDINFIGSKGDWAACETCCDLVVCADRVGLTERTYEALTVLHPEILMLGATARANLKQTLKDLHIKFFRYLLSRSPNPV